MTETAVFGGGCFWCTEAVFKMLKGVSSVAPGYAGGRTDNPTYMQVMKGGTGHAEVVRIEYDPTILSFHSLLTVFFATHDPTTLNRQGADIGEEYRSVILATTPSQEEEAKAFMAQLNASSEKGAPIVTEVVRLQKFYDAEEYHKNYYEKNKQTNRYCEIVINPKLEKVQKEFSELLSTIN